MIQVGEYYLTKNGRPRVVLAVGNNHVLLGLPAIQKAYEVSRTLVPVQCHTLSTHAVFMQDEHEIMACNGNRPYPTLDHWLAASTFRTISS